MTRPSIFLNSKKVHLQDPASNDKVKHDISGKGLL